jgi:hypothetical protein
MRRGGGTAAQRQGCSPYIGAVLPSCQLAVGPTYRTVGQPLVETAVGRLLPLALAVGDCRAGHVAGHRIAVGRGDWRALNVVGKAVRPYRLAVGTQLPFGTAVGTQLPFETAVQSCKCCSTIYFRKINENINNSSHAATF